MSEGGFGMPEAGSERVRLMVPSLEESGRFCGMFHSDVEVSVVLACSRPRATYEGATYDGAEGIARLAHFLGSRIAARESAATAATVR